MSQIIRLFSNLKNTDLQCLSAYEAINEMLGYKSLKGLRRLTIWEVEVEGIASEEGASVLEKVLKQSYYLINPNKEHYQLNQLKAPSVKDGQSVFLAKVISENEFDDQQTIRKIQQKFGIQIKSLSRSVLWEMIVENQSLTYSELQEDLFNKVIISSSRENGLLINPVHQRCEWLATDSIYLVESKVL
jgi:hypothetical protein